MAGMQSAQWTRGSGAQPPRRPGKTCPACKTPGLHPDARRCPHCTTVFTKPPTVPKVIALVVMIVMAAVVAVLAFRSLIGGVTAP